MSNAGVWSSPAAGPDGGSTRDHTLRVGAVCFFRGDRGARGTWASGGGALTNDNKNVIHISTTPMGVNVRPPESIRGIPAKNTPLNKFLETIRGGILIWGGILSWNSPDRPKKIRPTKKNRSFFFDQLFFVQKMFDRFFFSEHKNFQSHLLPV